MEILPGKPLGPYEILSAIGAGWGVIGGQKSAASILSPSVGRPEAGSVSRHKVQLETHHIFFRDPEKRSHLEAMFRMLLGR